jgi:ribosomal protein S18 acetylase RimI-like enzyme
MILKDEITSYNDSDFFMIDLIEREDFGESFTKSYILNNIVNVKDPISSCFVYRSEGLCLGFILFNNYDEQSEVLIFAVKKEFSRKGIGSALMDRVKEISKIITIEVRCSNTNAIRFYEKSGFKLTVKKVKYYDNEDGLYYIWKKK